MVIKQLGRAVMNGLDEIAGGVKTNLLTAYEQVSIVLKEGCPFDFETIKQYLFHNDMSSFMKENDEII